MRWIRNTDGREDAVLTLAVMAFAIIALKLLLSGVVLEFEGNKYTFGEPDASVIGALLGPTLGAYVGRRWTEKRYPKKETVSVPPPDDRDAARESIS